MKRLAVLALLLGVTMLAVPAGGWARPLGQTDVVSGGIGLSRTHWEAAHGAGDAGQNYVSYEDGTYFVQFRSDVVSFLEFGWEDPGIPFAAAEATARDFIPSDARLTELFAAPATAGGPIGLAMQRYTSRALVDEAPELGPEATGSIVVIYNETPAPDRFEPNVVRVSITIGIAS